MSFLQQPYIDVESAWTPPDPTGLPSWANAKRVGLDTETCDPTLTTLGPGVRRGGFIAGISFKIEDGPGKYLSINHQGGDNMDPDVVREYMIDQAANFTGEIVGINLPYDLDYLAEWGIIFRRATFRDVGIAAVLINEIQSGYSLNHVAAQNGLPGKSEAGLAEAAAAWGLNPKADIWRLPARHVAGYAVQDAVLPLRILQRQDRMIETIGLEEIWDLESRVLPISVKMRRRGVRIDKNQLEPVAAWALGKEETYLAEVHRATGVRIMPGDVWKAKMIGRALAAIGIDPGKTPSGLYKTDADTLNDIDHDVGRWIVRARKFNKLRTTFIASLERYLIGDRIHGTFRQIKGNIDGRETDKGVAFGRGSMADPNLQQIYNPEREPEISGQFRNLFLPDEGGEWGANDFSCYDADTEILTREGWIRFPNLHDSQEVAQWDSGTISYVRPEKLHVHEFNGNLVRIRGDRQIDFCVTPNHDCVLLKKDISFKVQARDLVSKKRGKIIPQSGILSGGIAVNHNLLRLVVAIQADASRRVYSYRFFLSKPAKILRLERLLEGRQYSRGFCKVKGKQTWFNMQDGWDIDEYLGPFKTFRRDKMLALDENSRRAFIEETLLWDNSGRTYVTTNCDNADIVQELAILTGYRSNLVVRRPERKKVQYCVSLNPKSGTDATSIKISDETYSGKVYCVTVPSGAVLVRRNGRVGVSGNSQEPRMTIHYAMRTNMKKPHLCTGISALVQKFIDDPDTDMHKETAVSIGRPCKKCGGAGGECSSCKGCGKDRKGAKTIFLGCCYGMGGYKLCLNLDLPTAERMIRGELRRVAGPEGQAILDEFHRQVPFVRDLSQACMARGEARGEIVTIKGRHLHFPAAPFGSDEDFLGTYKALNRLIQGSSADQTKWAMVLVEEAGHKLQLQIHDELCLTVSGLKQARAVAKIMENAVTLEVPSRVESVVGPSWGEAS